MDYEEQLNRYIGKQIQGLRFEKGWTQEKLAEEADVDQKHLGEIERGKASTSIHYLFRISAGLGLKDPLILFRSAAQEVYPSMKKKL